MKPPRKFAIVVLSLSLVAALNAGVLDDPRAPFYAEWSQTCDDFLDMDQYPGIETPSTEWYGGCYCASSGCNDEAGADFCDEAHDMCSDFCDYFFGGINEPEWWCEGPPTYQDSWLFHCRCNPGT